MFPHPVDTSTLRTADHRHVPAFAQLLPDVIRAEPGAVVHVDAVSRLLRSCCLRHKVEPIPLGTARRLMRATGFRLTKDANADTWFVHDVALVRSPRITRSR
ncbi:hypothetical protein OHA60_06595 [Streptomyces cellulosae]|jgi:hypothetical protein|nr:hypothetical protein OHA60_06595 [Streptomyces cellulosae]